VVEIKGLEKFAAKDFPGYISSTVFLGNCNFRCPYCHNADLVLRPESLPTLPLDYFLCYLDARKNWLEAICISGGEPLLETDLEDLVRVVKERNLLIKVDTNGSLPARLEDLFRQGLVDYVAMDVKAPLERYKEVTRSEVRPEDISRTIKLVRSSGIRHIFRTTVVPGLVGRNDLLKIAQMLEGEDIFQIQPFIPANTVDKRFLQVNPFSREEIEEMAGLVRRYFAEVRVEGG
jgi:pyruvate formate lyase activating enzyme